MAEVGQNRPCHDSYAPVEVGVLHSAILLESFRTMEDVVGNLRKEGRLNKDVSDPAPLQLAHERIRFGSGTPQQYESLSSQIFSEGTTIVDELRAMILMSSLPSSWETFVTTVCNTSTTVICHN